MVTIFNRKELIRTFGSTDQFDICDRLEAYGIDFVAKRTRRGGFRKGQQNKDALWEIVIYVRRDEYALAYDLLW